MNRYFLITTTILLFLFTASHGQQAGLSGKWLTPDGAVISFNSEGNIFTGKQTSAALEKDRKQNGKTVGKDIKAKGQNIFEGTVINPENDKSYNGRFTINPASDALELKVKWGFFNFKETWKRIK